MRGCGDRSMRRGNHLSSSHNHVAGGGPFPLVARASSNYGCRRIGIFQREGPDAMGQLAGSERWSSTGSAEGR